MYRVMTAILYYGGLRPSEVVMLRAGSLNLPAGGWGHIDVVEADVSFDQPGEPKTGPRRVLNRPGIRGGSLPWERGWSYAYTGSIWVSDRSAVHG
jgi:hypothetical protein